MTILKPSNMNPDALKEFAIWWQNAQEKIGENFNAACLATHDDKYGADVRFVLVKILTKKGFVFFTNYNSVKAQQIAKNPHVALAFYWKELKRQVRIRGCAKKIAFEESDKYFQSRLKGSQIAVLSSKQSSSIASKDALEQAFTHNQKTWAHKTIPCPNYWGGYEVEAQEIEFWQEGMFRLHDRLLYTKNQNESWSITRLSP